MAMRERLLIVEGRVVRKLLGVLLAAVASACTSGHAVSQDTPTARLAVSLATVTSSAFGETVRVQAARGGFVSAVRHDYAGTRMVFMAYRRAIGSTITYTFCRVDRPYSATPHLFWLEEAQGTEDIETLIEAAIEGSREEGNLPREVSRHMPSWKAAVATDGEIRGIEHGGKRRPQPDWVKLTVRRVLDSTERSRPSKNEQSPEEGPGDGRSPGAEPGGDSLLGE